MSSYEDYTQTSANYDRTRVPIGLEILLGCLCRAPRPLHQVRLLDAGCGTGSYTQALLPHVGHVQAVDMNAGMLSVAQAKLEREHRAGRVAFTRARIDCLPFEAQCFDAVMMNQVIHHVPDTPALGYPALGAVFAECSRVLAPGGRLILNTCTHEQLRRSWWYYGLIAKALERCIALHAPVADLRRLLGACGLAVRDCFVPVTSVIQGPAYFDVRGPLRKDWRDGDSIWALATDDEIEGARREIAALDSCGKLEDYVERHDAPRSQLGQVTFILAVKEGTSNAH